MTIRRIHAEELLERERLAGRIIELNRKAYEAGINDNWKLAMICYLKADLLEHELNKFIKLNFNQ